MKSKQVESTEDFKSRIAAIVGPTTREANPCVRKPSDRGYYPYSHWTCAKCGHEVYDTEKPQPIKWTDGHVCRFVEAPEEIQTPGRSNEEPPTYQLSKWWRTESCQRALERAGQARRQRIQKLRETVAKNDERRARELATWEEVDS